MPAGSGGGLSQGLTARRPSVEGRRKATNHVPEDSVRIGSGCLEQGRTRRCNERLAAGLDDHHERGCNVRAIRGNHGQGIGLETLGDDHDGVVRQIAQSEVEVPGVNRRHWLVGNPRTRWPGWGSGLALVLVVFAIGQHRLVVSAGDRRDRSGSSGVAQDRDVADSRLRQCQQEGVAGRVIADLADQLNLRPGGGRSAGDLDRPAGGC